MHPDTYLSQIISRHSVANNVFRQGQLNAAANEVASYIRNWAGTQLSSIDLSGSNAKGTGIISSNDIDLFISLHSNTRENLRELYQKLNARLRELGYQTRLQNVSIGITHNGFKVDLVPAVRQNNHPTDHSLYKRKQDTWTKTNIHTHINQVRSSGKTDVIKAIKIWREKFNLDFPSFYLELSVINALRNSPTTSISYQLSIVLVYLRDNLLSARIVDPANTNNIISDDLTIAEKTAIKRQAETSLNQTSWGQVIW